MNHFNSFQKRREGVRNHNPLDMLLISKRYFQSQPTIYTSWGNNFRDIKITLGKNERLVEYVSAHPAFQAGGRKENIEFKKPV